MPEIPLDKPEVEHHVRLVGSEKCFTVAAGETVLAASRRAGLALPYSCLSGRCGSCSARVISGKWGYEHPTTALNAAERVDHALLCQAHAQSDLSLEIRELSDVAALSIHQLGATVLSTQLLGHDVLAITLQPAQPVRYLAGQYLEFVLADGKRRPFSIANAPRVDGMLELHVRKVAGGGFTQYLFDEVKTGTELLIDLPHGTFVPRAHSDRPLILVAGGTGFAPIKALLEHFASSAPERTAHLYWGAREASDFYLLERVPALQQQMPNLQFTPVLSEQVSLDARYGSLHETVLEDYPTLLDHDLYMSGPPMMIASCRSAFLAAGLPEDRLYYDSFDFAPDVLAKVMHARRIRSS